MDRLFARGTVLHAVATAAVAAMLTAAVVPVAAATDPGVACATSKLKAAVKKLGSKVECHVTGLKKGLPADTACLAKAHEKFEADADRHAVLRHRGAKLPAHDTGVLRGRSGQ